MLYELQIENIAVIKKAIITFSKGFNVMTGETGAGKSIVIDSINAVLGERTSRELIRTGSDAAFVSALFYDRSEQLSELLDELDKEDAEYGTKAARTAAARRLSLAKLTKVSRFCSVPLLAIGEIILYTMHINYYLGKGGLRDV